MTGTEGVYFLELPTGFRIRVISRLDLSSHFCILSLNDPLRHTFQFCINFTVVHIKECINSCILWIASSGHYGIHMIRPRPQCVEIFLLPPPRGQGIVGRVLKFAGYIHRYKILTGKIFGLNLKKKMAARGVSLSVMMQCAEIFSLPPVEQKV